MKPTELRQGEQVVFLIYDDIYKKEIHEIGNVIYVDDENKRIGINYLEGYKSRSEDFNYNKVIAKYDKNGEFMKFGSIKGNSILINEEE